MPRSSDSKLAAVELKDEGNQLFRLGKYDQAAIKFTKAIELDRSNAVLYANRAACHLALKRFVSLTLSTSIKPLTIYGDIMTPFPTRKRSI